MEGAQRRRPAIPAEVSTPRAKLVYFALEVTGGATVKELQELLALRKLTLLSILDSLSEQSVVEYTGSQYETASAA